MPVEYQLTWVDGGDGSSLLDINNSGVAVGRIYFEFGDGSYINRAIRWTRLTGVKQLDDLSNEWIDLNTNSSVTGWSASTAADINDSGRIVGYADKEGEDRRAFIFDDAFGFWLLPTVGVGTHLGFAINEQGDVLGDYRVNGDFLDCHVFYWTPLRRNEIALALLGHTVRTHGHRMSDAHFTCEVTSPGLPGEIDYQLFRYSVYDNGTLDCVLASDLDDAWSLGIMSGNSLVPMIAQTLAKVRGRWTQVTSAVIYDAVTGQSTTIAPAHTAGAGVESARMRKAMSSSRATTKD